MNIKLLIILTIYTGLAPYHALASKYISKSCGAHDDVNRKIFIFSKKGDGYQLDSPFHTVKLFPSKNKNIVNMVVEIPQGKQEKMEINKEEPFNPLMYDIKNDKIRMVAYQARKSPLAGYPFHYGALPQTWEHSGVLDPHTKMYGDNDPVDAFDISSLPTKPGDIIKVKVLGAIAMIDNKETDWKLVVINVNDPQASELSDIDDISFGTMHTIYDFLLNYKTAEGKEQNEFFNGQIFWNHEEAIDIIEELHSNWQQLCQKPETTKKTIENNRPEKVGEIPQCLKDTQPKFEEPSCPIEQ